MTTYVRWAEHQRKLSASINEGKQIGEWEQVPPGILALHFQAFVCGELDKLADLTGNKGRMD